MAYCEQADILEQVDEDVLIQLTDDADAGEVDNDKVTRAIADADAEIDGYCGSRYSVPFSTVPDMIRKLSVDISVFNLYARRMGAPEDRKLRYDNAVRYLKDVSKGYASLGVQPVPDAPGEGDYTGGSRVTVRDKVFDEDTMDKY